MADPVDRLLLEKLQQLDALDREADAKLAAAQAEKAAIDAEQARLKGPLPVPDICRWRWINHGTMIRLRDISAQEGLPPGTLLECPSWKDQEARTRNDASQSEQTEIAREAKNAAVLAASAAKEAAAAADRQAVAVDRQADAADRKAEAAERAAAAAETANRRATIALAIAIISIIATVVGIIVTHKDAVHP
jgi:hypothetical protein